MSNNRKASFQKALSAIDDLYSPEGLSEEEYKTSLAQIKDLIETCYNFGADFNILERTVEDSYTKQRFKLHELQVVFFPEYHLAKEALKNRIEQSQLIDSKNKNAKLLAEFEETWRSISDSDTVSLGVGGIIIETFNQNNYNQLVHGARSKAFAIALAETLIHIPESQVHDSFFKLLLN